MYRPITGIAIGIAIFTGFAAQALGDSICVTGGGCDLNWQPFVTPVAHAQAPDADGPVYFDGYSWDAPNANIAYFIEGLGAFAGDPASPQARLPFWGNPDGSAVTSFYFQSNGQVQIADLVMVNGLWAPSNSIGWYDPNSSAWGWIFQGDGSGQAPQTVAFTPSAEFGLFFSPDSTTYNPQESYYTDSTRNGIAAADVAYAAANNILLGAEHFQHFAVFNDGNAGYYIGVKDRSLQIGDHDYNDMVIRLSESPEPGSLWILAVLVAGWFAFRSREAVV